MNYLLRLTRFLQIGASGKWSQLAALVCLMVGLACIAFDALTQKFTALNLDELPVVDDQQPGQLLGFLRRKETIAAYNQRILEHRRAADQ